MSSRIVSHRARALLAAVVVAGVLASATPSAADVRHTVRWGETLVGIARANGTSVGVLARANSISNPNLIRPGQVLTVPTASAPTARVHVVARGDTLWDIGRRYGVSARALATVNGITSPTRLRIGQPLTVPGASAAAAPSPAQGAASRGTSAYNATGGADGITGLTGAYTVARGESLPILAKRFGVSAADLAAANGIALPYSLYVGTRLQLTARNRLPVNIAQCPVPGARFFNDWGLPRSGGRAHEGNDLLAPRGTPVRAPVTGTVAYITGSRGGQQFKLRGDDGMLYWGTHLDRVGRTGRVAAGDVVGYVGDTGNASGGITHLHFEILPGGGPAMNPYPVLKAACG